MLILNFTMFVDKVISGKKRQTIRKTRKRPIKVGDKLYLYTGLRTKKARNLCQSIKDSKPLISLDNKYYVICKEVYDIYLDVETIHRRKDLLLVMVIDSELQDGRQMKEVAQKEGFFDLDEMFDFFEKTHGLPFHGQIIKW